MATTTVPVEVGGSEWTAEMPMSPAIRAGDYLFISGQLPLDERGNLVSPADSRSQAAHVLDSLQRVVEAAGGSLDDVVDLISFHTDLRELGSVMEIARGYFQRELPAWTPVGMTGSIASGISVCIRAIACLGPDPKRCHTPESSWQRRLGASGVCAKENLVFVAGQLATDDQRMLEHAGDAGAQSRRAYENVRMGLESVGANMDDVLDICSFHLDPRAMIPAERIHMETWRGTPIPNAAAWTAIGVPALPVPGALAQYRVIADLSPGPRLAQTPASIHWKNTPNSGGSRKQGGSLIGIAGEVASDAEGNVTTPGDTLGQARYAFNRIREVVEMHGSSMDQVVEVTAFHKDHRAWEIVLEAAREYFDPDHGPALTSVGAVGFWNPGYLHEIHALAVV